MKNLLSICFTLFTLLILGCFAPATGSISHTRPSGSNGIDLPDSFKDARWSEWKAYDQNYDYWLSTYTNGIRVEGSFAASTFSFITPQVNLEHDINMPLTVIVNNDARTIDISGAMNYIPNGDWSKKEVRHMNLKLQIDPNWLEGTLHLNVLPELNPSIGKTVRMRRSLTY